MDIEKYRHLPPEELVLKLSRTPGVDAARVVRQVEGWQRLRHKVPGWAAVQGLEYPPRLPLEQCSGEAAARYKTQVVRRLQGSEQTGRTHPLHRSEGAGKDTMVDLTGGLGVDFSFLSALFGQSVYVERQEELCQIARHNFPLLGLAESQIVCADGTDYLRTMPHADLIFLDPARRDGLGRKTVRIADCEPDVSAMEALLVGKARWVLVKLSPMLDISEALRALLHVREVHTVAAGGECKELLLVLEQREKPDGIRMFACEEGTVFSFTPREEAEAAVSYAPPARYLYEPGPALLKAGAFKVAACRYGLSKLHPNSHLYTSDREVAGFPGRSFRVEFVTGFSKAELRQLRSFTPRANLAVRNFPAPVEELRRKLKLRDGGDLYLFATTLHDDSHALVGCHKTGL